MTPWRPGSPRRARKVMSPPGRTPSTGLQIWCYTSRCVYEQAWNEWTTMARGLVIDPAASAVVATPFEKFFNYGEGARTFPDLPFEVFEKLDGSLVIIFQHQGHWLTATKGAFDSPQARWAQARLDQQDLSPLVPGATYLAEAVYPENKIIVHYDEPALVMLGGYSPEGFELDHDTLVPLAAQLGWRTAERHAFASVADLITHTTALPRDREGYVVRFADGTRLKLKGAEYRRLHALISRCTPIAIWEILNAGDDLESIRRDLPEELWSDFDLIVSLIRQALARLLGRIAEVAATVADRSDKELGLTLGELPEDVRAYVFSYRKGNGNLDLRATERMWREIRPTANELAGYVPSYAMRRIEEELL